MIGRSNGNGHSMACSVADDDGDPHLCLQMMRCCFPPYEIGALS